MTHTLLKVNNKRINLREWMCLFLISLLLTLGSIYPFEMVNQCGHHYEITNNISNLVFRCVQTTLLSVYTRDAEYF